MKTTDRLADALLEAGLPGLADRARRGEFDDFLSEHAFPQLELVRELTVAEEPGAEAIKARVINGDFDATPEEAEAWAASEDGQATFARLDKHD